MLQNIPEFWLKTAQKYFEINWIRNVLNYL